MTTAVMRSGVAAGRRVVRRADVVGVVHPSVDERVARLIVLLEDWARWCERMRVDLGYPNKSAGISTGGSVYGTDHYEADDADKMQRVEAGIDDLAPAERAAIWRRYGVAAVFRFNREPFEVVLDRAHQRLLVILPKKTIDI